MKPVCVPCQRFYHPKKNGYYWTEMMPGGSTRVPAGTRAPDEWRPYKIWSGDLWECPDCFAKIVVGVPNTAISEHFHDDFETQTKTLNADQLKINDC